MVRHRGDHDACQSCHPHKLPNYASTVKNRYCVPRFRFRRDVVQVGLRLDGRRNAGRLRARLGGSIDAEKIIVVASSQTIAFWYFLSMAGSCWEKGKRQRTQKNASNNAVESTRGGANVKGTAGHRSPASRVLACGGGAPTRAGNDLRRRLQHLTPRHRLRFRSGWGQADLTSARSTPAPTRTSRGATCGNRRSSSGCRAATAKRCCRPRRSTGNYAAGPAP